MLSAWWECLWGLRGVGQYHDSECTGSLVRNKMACAPSEDSDQSGHPPSLIRVFAVRMKKAWVLGYILSAQRRLWWAYAQADLSLRWAHVPFCWFCHDAAHFTRNAVSMRNRFVVPSLIRVFAVRMKKAWVLNYPLSAQRRLWSDWADAQADLSLRWAHIPFCWFCHEAAQFSLTVSTRHRGLVEKI